MEDYEMKKTYISPVVDAIRIEKRLLTSASAMGIYNDNVNDTGDLLGRGLDFDDDEE